MVTSIVRGRGRVIGVVAMLTTAMALVSVPAALGAVDGDPIASSRFTFELSKGLKKQLKVNGVKVRKRLLNLTKGDVDPTTGAADVRFGDITFKKGRKAVTFANLKGSLPGKISSSRGKIFRLTAPASTTRHGFGADLGSVNVKLLGSAAKKINKKLGLHSMHKRAAGSFTLDYQPSTVKIVSGTAAVTGSTAPGTVVAKMLGQHCAIPGPIAPATQAGLTLTFPVGGGTISPLGLEGVIQQQGGTRIAGLNPGQTNCQGNPASLTQSEFAVNLALQNIQAHVVLEKGPPGVLTGDRGIAITQLADPTGSVIVLNVSNHTISINNATIKINQVSADSLNLFFPQNPGGNPANDFQDGDIFGSSNLTVTVR